MWTEILKAALTLGALGLIMGVLLAVASRIFAVHTDERVEEIVAILPGANCGGCGFAGCAAYANAVVKGEASPSACVAGGAAAAQGIAKILGVDVDTRELIVQARTAAEDDILVLDGEEDVFEVEEETIEENEEVFVETGEDEQE